MTHGWRVEGDGREDSGPCPCCGSFSRLIWGIVRGDGVELASYWVHWTLGQVAAYGAHFDVVFNSWREDSGRIECCAASLEYRLVDGRPTFMMIDSANRNVARKDFIDRPLNRVDVIGDPLAQDIFAICDVIVDRDDRLAELHGDNRIRPYRI
jgi:hypothetical protein